MTSKPIDTKIAYRASSPSKWPDSWVFAENRRHYGPAALRADDIEDYELPNDRPLTIEARRWNKLRKLRQVRAPYFLVARMSVRRLAAAYDRAQAAIGDLCGAARTAALVAGAVLTDGQLKWLRDNISSCGKKWHAIADYTRPRISHKALRALVKFGVFRSKRHHYAACMPLTSAAEVYCASMHSRQVTSEVFWEDIRLLQRLRGYPGIGTIVSLALYDAFRAGRVPLIEVIDNYIPPIKLLSIMAGGSD